MYYPDLHYVTTYVVKASMIIDQVVEDYYGLVEAAWFFSLRFSGQFSYLFIDILPI